jgi:sensor c-di-GMP phosphodiesterase-like protein
MGRAFNVEIVAEGVETQRQAFALRNGSVPLAQGFLFARPMPADDFTIWIIEALTARSPSRG